MKPEETINYFIKFFNKEEYADEFLKGKLFINTLGYFKDIEDADGRGDIHEGISHWLQPDDLKSLIIKTPDGKTVDLVKDLAGPIKIGYNWFNNINIYCLYALGTYSLYESGEIISENLDILESRISVHSRCKEFGRWAVIVSARDFMEKTKNALNIIDCRWRSGLVDYYDEKIFSGEFSEIEAPFKKHQKFSYQKEYRFCIYPPSYGDNEGKPITLDIGDISSRAIKLTTDEVINEVKLIRKK